MNTAEMLVKESEGILEESVLVPMILQKCAERGYVPEDEAQMDVILKQASKVREMLVSGEIAPIPVSACGEDGTLSKQASEALEADPLAFGETFHINLADVEPQVKEAAAIGAWAALEAVAATA